MVFYCIRVIPHTADNNGYETRKEEDLTDLLIVEMTPPQRNDDARPDEAEHECRYEQQRHIKEPAHALPPQKGTSEKQN